MGGRVTGEGRVRVSGPAASCTGRSVPRISIPEGGHGSRFGAYPVPVSNLRSTSPVAIDESKETVEVRCSRASGMKRGYARIGPFRDESANSPGSKELGRTPSRGFSRRIPACVIG